MKEFPGIGFGRGEVSKAEGRRVEFDIDVFDAARLEALIERLRRVLVAMTANSGQQS